MKLTKKKNQKQTSKKTVTLVTQSPGIDFQHVDFIYHPKTVFAFQALRNINLKLYRGGIIGIAGSTGCGKSTLIQHANGLFTPTKGVVCARGVTITAHKRKIKNIKILRQRVGLVFQYAEQQLFEDTVLKDVCFGPVQFGKSRPQAEKLAAKYLKIVGLDKSYLSRSPFNLSGGEKRRVAIAGVLAIEPQTIILDEPTAGLDPKGRNHLLQILRELVTKKPDLQIIIVSHNMDDLLATVDYLVVMQDGAIIAQDTPFNIFQQHKLVAHARLKLPLIYRFITDLQKQGLSFPVDQIRTLDDVALSIATTFGDSRKREALPQS